MERWEDKGQFLLSNHSNPNKCTLQGKMTSWLTAINVEKVISAWLDVMPPVSISRGSRRPLEKLWMRRLRSAMLNRLSCTGQHRWHAGDNFFSRSLTISANAVLVHLTLCTPCMSIFFFLSCVEMFPSKFDTRINIYRCNLLIFSPDIGNILELYTGTILF